MFCSHTADGLRLVLMSANYTSMTTVTIASFVELSYLKSLGVTLIQHGVMLDFTH